jgi:SAM-dependent methyltransferase
MPFGDVKNSKQRFTNRVADYRKARPTYPPQLVHTLSEHCGLTPDSWIADIGSGTGLLSEVFLKNGNPVYGVEPNQAMRQGGEAHLQEYDRFVSVDGSAEDTTLPDACCDFVVAGQAFHWFEAHRAQAEFRRILQPGGWVVLVWNLLPEDVNSELNREYGDLFRQYGVDYQGGSHRAARNEQVRAFFQAGTVAEWRLPNPLPLDAPHFQSRVFSSSQAPQPGHPHYAPMQTAVMALFERYQVDGIMMVPYETLMYAGRLATASSERSAEG